MHMALMTCFAHRDELILRTTSFEKISNVKVWAQNYYYSKKRSNFFHVLRYMEY